MPPERTRKKVTAVLPAYNAEKTVQKTYEAIPKEHVHEVILVDDASVDNTVARAEEIKGLIVLIHDKNRGYGGNQKTCYAEALKRGADVVIMIHPDFQYDPSYVPQMIAPILAGEADFVMGSRFKNQDPRAGNMDWWRFLGNRFLTTLQNAVLGTAFSECHSGYRAYTRALLEAVPFHRFPDDFAFDAHMIVAIAKRNFRTAEVTIPVRYAQDSSSASFAASVRYGFATLRSLLPGAVPLRKCSLIRDRHAAGAAWLTSGRKRPSGQGVRRSRSDGGRARERSQ